MNRNLIWIYILVIQLFYATSRPVQEATNTKITGYEANENIPNHSDEKVISVRITSSVVVARGNGKFTQRITDYTKPDKEQFTEVATTTESSDNKENLDEQFTDLPSNLRGANIEFLKQLNAKKEPKAFSLEQGDNFQSSPNLGYDGQNNETKGTKNEQTKMNDDNFQSTSKLLSSDDFNNFRSRSTSILEQALKLADRRSIYNDTYNANYEKFTDSKPVTEDTYLTTYFDDSEFSDQAKDSFGQTESDSKESKEIEDSIAESSLKSVMEIANKHHEDYENIENVPLARSIAQSPSSKNYIQGLNNKPPSERESSTRLTTVSFNIVHDAPKMTSYNDPGKPYVRPSPPFQDHKFYESPTIYSRPAQIYSEPAKIYSEPAKIYSEPAKIYSEPAKIYSEPAKIYSEPAKFYSEPASLHLKPNAATDYSPWQLRAPTSSTTLEPAAGSTVATPDVSQPKPTTRQQPQSNYEVEEKVSVVKDGRSHGVQESTTEKCKQDNCKVGYVVKGRQFNKYRVEERTSDGFIVGEYGVVRNEDGALRGVRYTADSEASPRLIYDALMKFLQLK